MGWFWKEVESSPGCSIKPAMEVTSTPTGIAGCWMQQPLEVTAKAGAKQQVLDALSKGERWGTIFWRFYQTAPSDLKCLHQPNSIMRSQGRRGGIPVICPLWSLLTVSSIAMCWIRTQLSSDYFWQCQELFLAASPSPIVWTDGLLFPMLSFYGFYLPEWNQSLNCSIL